jgi:hypothetical protein
MIKHKYKIGFLLPLVIFMVIGPAIGAISTGEFFSKGISPLVLIPVYIFGGALAIWVWILYSLVMSTLIKVQNRMSLVGPEYDFMVFAVIGALVGTVMGFVIFNLVACGTGRFLFGGWVGCLENTIDKYLVLSILPGAACGGMSALFIERADK